MQDMKFDSEAKFEDISATNFPSIVLCCFMTGELSEGQASQMMECDLYELRGIVKQTSELGERIWQKFSEDCVTIPKMIDVELEAVKSRRNEHLQRLIGAIAENGPIPCARVKMEETPDGPLTTVTASTIDLREILGGEESE
jgi:hypothetical protein